MTTSPAVGILAILEAIPGFSTGWILATDQLSDKPDKQVIVKDTGGRGAEHSVAIDYPTVQIIVRGGSGSGGYTEAYDKVIACRDALVCIPSATTEYPELTSCTQRGNPVPINRDDAGRPRWSLNLNLIVSYDVSGYRIL